MNELIGYITFQEILVVLGIACATVTFILFTLLKESVALQSLKDMEDKIRDSLIQSLSELQEQQKQMMQQKQLLSSEVLILQTCVSQLTSQLHFVIDNCENKTNTSCPLLNVSTLASEKETT